MNEKSGFSKTVTGYFVAFDRHCLIYFFMIGCVLGCINPQPEGPLVAGFVFCAGFGIFWYSIKALLITGDTITRMRANGEPLFKDGGLTEYDSEKCRRTGEEVARAIRDSNKS